MPLSPALQKLVEDGAKKFSSGAPTDCADDFDLTPPVKIKFEIELFPGETRTITIKAE